MTTDPQLDAFDFHLPPDRIAQTPCPERDGARLLVLDRRSGTFEDAYIRDLPRFLDAGDLVVVNASAVLPARLRGRKETGGAAEALFLERCTPPGHWRALVRSSGRQRVGQKFVLGNGEVSFDAEIVELGNRGEVTLALDAGADPYAVGEMPLPPYIRRPAPDARDQERYQTTFARVPGSVAAPTAGLHFSKRLLADLQRHEIGHAEVILHVGPGTFRPLESDQIAQGQLHPERYELPESTATKIRDPRARGHRVIAVGRRTARVLESCADESGVLEAGSGETRLFLRPGSRFRAIDALLTNFHLPRSSLLMLVAAYAGTQRLLNAYEHAVADGYRFYSYGDAMLIR